MSRSYTREEIEANKTVFNEHFSLAFVRTLNDQVLEKIINPTYFRPVFIGFDEPVERNRPDRPAILASNHSGMAFPWDAIVFGCGMFRKFGYETDKLFRPLAAPVLSKTRLMNPFMMRDAWKMCGGIDATFLNFQTLMEYPEGNVLVYPEGVPGIGKGFNHRYRLQRLATSFVRMSLQHRTDIVPFATVNAEYVNPYSYSVEWVNRFVSKLGVPFLPLSPITILVLLQPWTFYLSFPAKMTYVRGRRLKPYEWLDKPYEALTDREVRAIRDRIKQCMQDDLERAVREHGQKPYRWGEFFRAAWKNRRFFPYYFPFMWPIVFTEFERQWNAQRVKDGSGVDMRIGWGTGLLWLLRNPIVLCYYLPVIGWIPLAIKGYSRKKKK